jgi:hypothetical protein
MRLAVFAAGRPILDRPSYTDRRNPGLEFTETVRLAPGEALEFWADANRHPRHAVIRLRARIAPADTAGALSAPRAPARSRERRTAP